MTRAGARSLQNSLAWAGDGAAHLRGLMTRMGDDAFAAPSALPGWSRAHVLTHTARNADEVWRTYFETLAEAARSGLYDIMGHPDLVKVWGRERPVPDGDPRFYYEPAVEAFAESGVAVEVSTAGWRKPAHEPYPSPALLEMCVEAGCPMVLSSDAHVPDELGYRYEDVVELLAAAGVEELCVFEGRRRRLEPIGAD